MKKRYIYILIMMTLFCFCSNTSADSMLNWNTMSSRCARVDCDEVYRYFIKDYNPSISIDKSNQIIDYIKTYSRKQFPSQEENATKFTLAVMATDDYLQIELFGTNQIKENIKLLISDLKVLHDKFNKDWEYVLIRYSMGMGIIGNDYDNEIYKSLVVEKRLDIDRYINFSKYN